MSCRPEGASRHLWQLGRVLVGSGTSSGRIPRLWRAPIGAASACRGSRSVRDTADIRRAAECQVDTGITMHELYHTLKVCCFPVVAPALHGTISLLLLRRENLLWWQWPLLRMFCLYRGVFSVDGRVNARAVVCGGCRNGAVAAVC